MWGGLGLEPRREPEPGPAPARPDPDDGERLAAKRLERHLEGSAVLVLHDLVIPGTHAEIDHICIGPGGVTVIAGRSYRGPAELRAGALWINGRRQTRLIDGVRRRIEVVRMVLAEAQVQGTGIEGALAITSLDGLPQPQGLRVDGILIDGPRGIAERARRPARGQPIDSDLVRAVIGAELGSREQAA